MEKFCLKCKKFKNTREFRGGMGDPNGLAEKCIKCDLFVKKAVVKKEKAPSLEWLQNKERLKQSIWCMSLRVC